MPRRRSPRGPDKARHDEDEIPEQKQIVQTPVQLDSAMDTESDEADVSIEDKYSGEMPALKARQILREAEFEEEYEGE